MLWWLLLKRQEIKSVDEDVEKREIFCTVSGYVTDAATMKTVCNFLYKLKIEVPYDPAVPSLHIYTKKQNHYLSEISIFPCLLQRYNNDKGMQTTKVFFDGQMGKM